MMFQHTKRRNRFVLCALAVWFIGAAVLFAWAGIQNVQFASRLQQSSGDLRNAVAAAPSAIKAAQDTGDVAATVTTLHGFSATLSQKVHAMPAAPTALGLVIGGDAERARHQRLREAAEAYAVKLSEAATYIQYQSQVARQLQGLSLKDASNYTQIIDLANAWRESIQTIQNSAKPQRVTTVIATMLQKMNTAETHIRAMADAYKNSDTAKFTAEQQQLAATIASFKENGTQIAAIGTQIDAELRAAAAKFTQNL